MSETTLVYLFCGVVLVITWMAQPIAILILRSFGSKGADTYKVPSIECPYRVNRIIKSK